MEAEEKRRAAKAEKGSAHVCRPRCPCHGRARHGKSSLLCCPAGNISDEEKPRVVERPGTADAIRDIRDGAA